MAKEMPKWYCPTHKKTFTRRVKKATEWISVNRWVCPFCGTECYKKYIPGHHKVEKDNE